MSSHPTPDALAAIALAGPDAVASGHTATCARCAAEVLEFRGLVGRLKALPLPPEQMRKAQGYFQRRRALDDLIERLVEDPALRAALTHDAAAVIREAGLEPTPELIAALRNDGRDGSGASERLAASLWF